MNIEEGLVKSKIRYDGQEKYSKTFVIPEDLKKSKELKNFQTITIVVVGKKETDKYNQNLKMAVYIMDNLNEIIHSALNYMIENKIIDKSTIFTNMIWISFNMCKYHDYSIGFREPKKGFLKRYIFHYMTALFGRDINQNIDYSKCYFTYAKHKY